MNQFEYRSQWPGLKVNYICKYQNKLMECISHPWEEGDQNLINIREPNNPVSMITVNVNDLISLELHCPDCKEISKMYLHVYKYIQCNKCLRRFTLSEICHFNT